MSRSTNSALSSGLRARLGRRWLAPLFAAAFLLSPQFGSAATDTWTTGTGTANWADANWTGTNDPPLSGDSLIFGATTGTTNLNDNLTSSAFNIGTITFSSGAPAYTMTGNTFTLTGGITDSSTSVETFSNTGGLSASSASEAFTLTSGGGNITITNGLTNTFAGTQTLAVGGTGTLTLGGYTLENSGTVSASDIINGTGNVTINGMVSGGTGTSSALTYSGTGTLTLSGASSNAFTGVTTVTAGTVTLAKTGGALAVASNINFGNGSSTVDPAIDTTQVNQFGANTVISFLNLAGGYARLQLGGNNQTLAGLSDAIGAGVVQDGGFGGFTATGNDTLTLDGSGVYSFAGFLRNDDGAGSPTLALTMSGPGTQTLKGANINYTGATTVNGGKLNLNSTTGFASATTVNSGGLIGATGALSLGTSLTFAGSGGIDLVDGSTATLTLSNASGITLAPTGGTPAPFNLETGVAAASDEISVTHTLTVGPGGVTVNVTNLSPSAQTYTIVNAGTLTNAAGFSLGTITNPGSFTYALSNVGNTEQLISTAATALTSAYFVGSNSAVFNAANNWALNATDTSATTALAPSTGTDVYMGVNSVTNLANLNMTLGASTTINSLTFTGTGTSAATRPITIGGAGTLTIAAAVGAYPVNTGIVVQSGSANHTINSNVALGQAQSWTVNGTSTLSVNGQVSGTGALTKAGSGTLVLSTAGTYSGATNITGGTLRLANSFSSLPVTTNLQVQLNATNAASLGNPANNAAVTAWNTASGSMGASGNFTGTGSYLSVDPNLNSMPAVHFNGSQALDNLTNFGSNETIIYVGRLSGTQNGRLVGGYSSNFLLGYWQGHQDTAYFSNGFIGTTSGTFPSTTATVAATTATHVYAGTIDSAGNTALYSSGIELATTGTGGTGPNGLVLGGGSGAGNGELSAGDIGELLVYNTVLSASQIQAVSNYLTDKWSGILPSATPVTISGGGTLDLNGLNQTVGSLNSTDPTTRVALGGGTLTTGSANTADSFVGVISDSGGANSGTGGGLSKIGTNTTTLGGTSANAYTGQTTVTTGALILSKPAGIAAIPGNLALDAATNSPNVWATANNQFGGANTVVSSFDSGAAGSLTLLGTTQTVAGLSSPNGGLMVANATPSSNTPSPTNASTGTLILVGSGNYTDAGWAWDSWGTSTGSKLALTVNLGSGGVQTLSGVQITYSGATAVNSGTLVLQGTNAYGSNITLGSSGTLDLVQTTPFASRSRLTLSITGSGTINVNNTPSGIGGGWTTFGGTTVGLSSFTGTVNVNSGVLSMDGLNGLWSGNPNLNVVSGGLFGLRGQSISIGALTGNGDVFNNYNGSGAAGNTLTVGANNGSGTFSGVIHGSLATGGTDGAIEQGITNLAKTGSGTETLSGVNTFTGTTTVSAGTLNLTGSFAGSNVTVNGSTAVFNESTTGAMAGSGTTFALTTGAATLSGTNTYGGGTTIGSGTTLQFGQITAMPATGTVAVSSGGTLVVNAGGSGEFTNATSGAGSIGGLLGGFGGQGGPVTFASGSALGIDTTNAGGSFTYAGAITNTGLSLTKLGTGALVLTGANTYTGTTTVASGALDITGSGTLGAATGALAVNGTSTLDLGTTSQTVGAVTIGGGTIQNGTLTGTSFTSTGGTVTASLAGTGAALTLNSGTLTLSGTNSYTGATTISGGTLSISALANINGNSSGAVAVQTGGTLQYTGAGAETRIGTLSWNNGAATINITQSTADLTFNMTGGTRNNPFTKSGPGTLTLSQSAAGNDVYSGSLTVTGGTLAFNPTTTATLMLLTSSVTGSAGTMINVIGPGTVRNDDLTANWSSNLASLNVASGTFDIRGNNVTVDALTGGGSSSIIDSFYEPTSGIEGHTLTVGVNNGSGTFSGAISGTGTTTGATGQVALTKTGTGIETLSGTNTIAGGITIAGGELSIGSSTNLGGVVSFTGGDLQVTGTSFTSFTVGNPTTFNGGFDIANAANAFTVSTSLSGSGAMSKLGAGTLILTGASNSYGGGTTVSAGTLQIGDGATNNGSLSGNASVGGSGTLAFSNPTALGYAGAISGGGAVTKSGAGTLTLSGTNLYTGTTTINAGTVRVTGSLANTAITVNSTGGLGGAGNGTTTGVVNGNVALSGGAISLVDGSLGMLTLTNGLSVGASSALNFEVGASGADLLAITNGSAFSVTAPATINITALGGLSTGTFNLITFGSGDATGLSNLSLGSSTVGGRNVSLQSTATSEELIVAGATAYWTGSLGAGQASWNAGSGTSTNWTSDLGGTAPTTVPTSTVDVYFTATGAGNLSTTLGANFDISSLHFNSTAATSVSITDPTFALTIEGGGITIDGGSGAHTIGTNGVVVNASQIWANNSNSLFTVTSGITGTATSTNTTTLTLAGSGTGGMILSGAIGDGTAGGNLALAVNTSGAAVVVSGSNTYSGGTTIAGGTLRLGATNSLPTSTSLMLGSAGANGILDLAGFSQQVGGLSVSSNVLSGNVASQIIGSSAASALTSTLTFSGGTSSFGGTIQDVLGTNNGQNVALAVAGGTLTLSGSNTYSGGTSISAGTLRLGASNTLPIGTNVTFGGASSFGTLDLGGFNQQVAGLSLGSGANVATQVIGSSGASSTTSTLTISGGTNTFAGTLKNVLGTNNGQLVGLTVSAGSLTLSGSGITYTGPTAVNGSSSLLLSNTAGFASSTTIASGATVNMAVSSGTLTVPASYTINGTGLLIKSGTGNWTIGSGNRVAMSMTGGTIDIQGGTIQDNNTTNEWASNLASMNVTSGAIMDAYADPVNADALTGSGTVQNGYPAIAMIVTIGDNNTQNNAAYGVSGNTATFSGTIGPSGTNANGVLTNFSLVKEGTGTQILTGTNNYTGNTTVSGGTLSVPSLAAIGGSATTGWLDLINSTFVYTGSGTETRTGPLYWNTGSGTMNITQASANLIFTPNNATTAGARGQAFTKTGPGALTINAEVDNSVTVNGGTMTINGLVTAGTMIATSGTLVLDGSAANTYTGFTNAQGGTVSVPSLGNLNNTVAPTNNTYLAIQSGGTFLYTGTGTESSTKYLYWNSGAATVNIPSSTAVLNWTPAGGTRNQTFTKAGAGELSVTGIVTGNTTVTGGTLQYIDSGYSGTIVNSGTVNLTDATVVGGGATSLQGTGTYNLSAASGLVFRLFGGAIDVGAGGQFNILGAGKIENDDVTADWSSNRAGMNVASGSTFDIRANNVWIDALTGSGSIINSFYETTQTGIQGNTLTVGVNNGSGTFGGVISGTSTVSGSGTGVVDFAKTGSGTETLSGPNTYGGTTTVSGGTLRVANASGSSATGVSAVTVASGGTLAGSLSPNQGFITGAVSVNAGGTLSASNGNTLTLSGGLTLASGSTFSTFDLTGTASANPLIATSGGAGGNSFVVNGTDAISVTGTPVAGTYDLFSFTNATAPTASSFTAPAAPAGTYYVLSVTSSQVDLTVTNTLTWTGNNTTNWDTSTPNNWAANATAETYTDTTNVVFNDTNATGGATPSGTVVVQAGGVAPASVTFNNTSTPVTGVAYTINTTGSTNGIYGSTGITLAGNGTVTLLGPNTYTGTTALNAGTLIISNNNSLGGGAAPLTFNGGSLQYAPGLTSNSISSDISGRAVTFASGGATIDINGNNVTYANPIGNSGSGSLTLLSTAGPATLTLAAANTYGGGSNVNSGTLRVSNTSISGSATGSGSVAVSSGAVLAGGGGSTPGFISGSVNIAGGGTIAPSGGGTSSAAGSLGTLTVGNLTLNNGATSSQLNYQYAAGPSPLDSIAVTNVLTLPSATGASAIQFNFYSLGNTSNFVLPPGLYTLMAYGSLGADSNLATLSVNPADLNGTRAMFSTTGNALDLNILTANASAMWASNGTDSGSMDYGTTANWSPTTVPSGAGLIATFGTGTQMTVSVNGAYTVGQLNFNNSISNAAYYLTGSGSLTLNNSGSGASVNVSNSGLSPSILTTLTLADSSLTTTFNVASGSSLDLAGTINESTPAGQKIVLAGGGMVTMEGVNTYTGGTTIQNGTLMISQTGVPGTGSMTFSPGSSNTAVLDVNTNVTLNNLSETPGSAGTAQLNVLSGSTLTLNQSASASFAGTLSLGGNAGLALNQGSGNTLTISGAPTLNDGSSISVNSGTLAFTNSASATINGNPTVSVASGATLQLAGSAAALSSAVNITTHGSGSASDGALTLVGNTTQTVGIVSGDTLSGTVTAYSGNTTVGDGTNVANLTATQILQNTLTINAGSTVTIAPSGSGIESEAQAVSGVALAAGSSDGSGDTSSDPFTAIQAAIASGSISSVKGQQLENRIAAIERLAATDPGLDVSLLEDRVLAAIPSSSVWSSSGSSPLGESGSGLLAVDGGISDSALGSAAATFAPASGFGGSPAAVPEPSTLLLAALGVMGMIFAARRKIFPNWLLLAAE